MIKLRQMMWAVILFTVIGQGIGFAEELPALGISDIDSTFSKATPATEPSQQTPSNTQPAPIPSKTIMGPAPSATETK